ncbi:TadE family protein [Arthrobacter sp. MYb213]|uniref:TadE family protein n=1 Tax=Arthrobacter sp. MYb213 TaxID=1848595 RepID=UPI000CFD08C0|nr:TadE family protein [Arthrobacter sp. MYb213]PRB67110.1 pilus assembly protein TadE [Arthrobacter sp. MYb213]
MNRVTRANARRFWKLGSEEAGSAVAEFVMITSLLIIIAVTLIQLTLVLHVRNTLIDAAANGAHYGALANRSPGDAAGRTRTLIGESLHSGFARNVQVSTSAVGEGQLVSVTVNTRVPLIGLLPNGWDLTVHGDAVRYD